MNAGKSTQLLQAAYNYTVDGHFIRCFTAAVDDRVKVGVIGSRLGINRDAEIFTHETDFYNELKNETNLSCVFVDEAQFLTKRQASQLHRAVHAFNLPILCFGLRTDFRGEPFPGSSHLLALADDIQEVKSLCSCRRKATMNIRIDVAGTRVREGESILIGGNERYRQVCAKCFYAT